MFRARATIKGVAALALAASLAVAQSEPSSHERMLELLETIQTRTADDHFYLSDRELRSARARFEGLRPDAPLLIRWEGHLRLGEQEQHVGNELEAIRHFEEAHRLLPQVEADIASEWIIRLYFRLGMAYMRFGETKNCAEHHAAESCILPIRGSGVHVDQEPSRKAIGYFEEVVERAAPTSDPYLSARWLMNIAYMTVDEYPDGVPADYLVAPKNFESDAEFPLFPNVAMSAGVATFSLSGGVVVEDFDMDGFLDLLVSAYDPWGQVQLFINKQDGTFTDRTAAANLTGIFGGLNMVQGDYDNDGDMDVFMLRGAWLGKGGDHPNSLLRNNGDGTFTDVTFAVGLGEVHYPTQTATWGDYDRDGDLDLYIGNETTEEFTGPCQLFQNQGDGTFVDVAEHAGVLNLRFAKGVVFGDYDSDGYLDIYVSNLDDENRLYRNLGDGTFVDVAEESGVLAPLVSFPVWFWDYDNDGNLDLFVSAYEAIIKDLSGYYLGRGYAGETALVYRGDGRGGFSASGPEIGLELPTAPMGANVGDLDNDGYLDFYLGTGYPPYFALMPNAMYWNRGGRRFDDVTTAGGFGHLQKGHAVAFADVDNDGDQDVFEQMGGALAGDRFNDVLYENPGFGNHWLAFRLVGDRSNRAGMGARIRVDVVEGDARRSIYKTVDSGGSFGANPIGRQVVGLGQASSVERVEIRWPSGVVQTIGDVGIDRGLVVHERAGRLR